MFFKYILKRYKNIPWVFTQRIRCKVDMRVATARYEFKYTLYKSWSALRSFSQLFATSKYFYAAGKTYQSYRATKEVGQARVGQHFLPYFHCDHTTVLHTVFIFFFSKFAYLVTTLQRPPHFIFSSFFLLFFLLRKINT